MGLVPLQIYSLKALGAKTNLDEGFKREQTFGVQTGIFIKKDSSLRGLSFPGVHKEVCSSLKVGPCVVGEMVPGGGAKKPPFWILGIEGPPQIWAKVLKHLFYISP